MNARQEEQHARKQEARFLKEKQHLQERRPKHCSPYQAYQAPSKSRYRLRPIN